MPQQLPEGTVTVLFTDVVGSTDLTTRQGDEAAQEILRAQRELVRQQVEEHSGHEVKGLGDGFMVAFATASKAVACAVGIQRALNEHNRSQAPDEQVLIRIGMNTGEVIQEEADLFGETVNAAARVAAKAKGGQIFISETTRGVMGRAKDVELVDRGRFRLKGFPERWRLYEVVWREDTAVGPALTERTPFVGREAERTELRRLLDQAAKGHGALAMIGGEPGVGKTRIAEELMAEARQRNMTALIGHCYEMEGALPYIPFVEMVEAGARLFPPETLREALGESAPEVAKLMPELRRLFPDIPEPPELPPEQERHYLFNGMRDFLARVGRAQPLLLVLDDLHWADDSTLLLLQHIAQQLQEMPVLILGTYRDVELDVAHPLARALEELLRQRLAHDVALKRLPEAEVGQMLGALSAQEPSAPLVQAIYAETEGNPFFVEEVFAHLAEEGKLFDDQGHWRSVLQVSELDVPRGVRLVIRRRLERVGEECRRVLTSAAVIGRGFSFELLEALSDTSAGSGQDIDADALLDAVDEAERAHLITSTSDGAEDRFTFAHELIRQTLLSDISAPRRRRLHLQVAEAMERVYARALEERAADLAHHLYQAGAAADPGKTVHYLTLAGEQVLAAVAYEEGVRLYEMALRALDLKEEPDEAQRCELLLALGEAQIKAGGASKAGEIFHRAADIARKSRMTEHLARAALGVGKVDVVGGGGQALVGLLEEALAVFTVEDHALRALLLARLAEALIFTGSGERMASLSREAEEIARRLDQPEVLATALYARYWALHELPDPKNLDEPLAVADEMVRLAEEVGDRERELLGRRLRIYELMPVGDIHAVDLEMEAYTRLAEAIQQPLYLWHIPLFQGMRALLEGRLEEAERLGQRVLAFAAQDPMVLTQFGIQLYELRRQQGRLGEMEAAIKGFVERDPGMVFVRAVLAFIYSETGREAEARAEFEGLAVHDFTAVSLDLLYAMAGLSETCAFLHDTGRAAMLYDLLLPYARRYLVVGESAACFGSASRYLGLLAATMSRWEEAAQHFEDAIEMNTRLEARPYLAHTQHDYARMLIDRDAPGDRDKAFRMLTEAIAMYRDIGMPKHVEMAEALLGEL